MWQIRGQIMGQIRRQMIPRQHIQLARTYLPFASSHWDSDFLLTLGEDLHPISRVEWFSFFAYCNSYVLPLLPTIQSSEVGSVSSWEELTMQAHAGSGERDFDISTSAKLQIQLGACKPRATLFSPSGKTKKSLDFLFQPLKYRLNKTCENPRMF